MANKIEIITDINGVERRCGSLEVPDGFVSAFPGYDTIVNPWPDDDIRSAITAPNRRPSRVTFNEKWTQNQLSHGSCNGFLVAQLMGKGRWLKGFHDGLLFSGAYPYSKMNNNQDNGSVLETGMHVICEQGDCLESLVNANMIYSRQQPKSADAMASLHKGYNPFLVQGLQQLRTALAQQIPVGIAVQFGPNFQRFDERGVGGIDNGSGNHAVVADDLVLIDGEEYLDVHNQHGNQFGKFKNGRGYYPMRLIQQTMPRHCFYILGSVTESETPSGNSGEAA